MFLILIFLFTVLPAMEIFLLFKIGGEIGGLNTLLVVLTTGIVGASLAKTQGLTVLFKIQNEMNTGKIPANQIIHGLMIFAGGLLLLTPGFLTDTIGFMLVAPGSRHFLMIWIKAWLSKMASSGSVNFQFFTSRGFGQNSYTSNRNDHNFSENVIDADYTKKD